MQRTNLCGFRRAVHLPLAHLRLPRHLFPQRRELFEQTDSGLDFLDDRRHVVMEQVARAGGRGDQLVDPVAVEIFWWCME